MNSADIREIFRRLAELRPDPKSELNYRTPFELLVAVVLSAQATDKSVNEATKVLTRTPPRRFSRSVKRDSSLISTGSVSTGTKRNT